MKRFIPIIPLFILLIYSCAEKKKSQQDLLFDKVIAVHDEIMPKMDDIMKYKKQLTQKMNALNDAGIEENAESIEAIKAAVADLDNSHDGMMEWMHNFDTSFKGMTEKEVKEYLNNQKAKIEQVGKSTNDALANAEKLLQP